MASHIEIGKAGEKLAAGWLAERGHQILHYNWRHGKDELDLITTKNGLLHFIEVKYRSSDYHGHPEEAVNKKKIKTLLRCIEAFLYLHPQYDDFRLDILSITEKEGKEVQYFLIEDVTL